MGPCVSLQGLPSPQVGDQDNQDLLSHSLEPEICNRRSAGCAPSAGSWGGSFLPLLLGAPGIPGLWLCHSSLCLCVSSFVSSKDTCHWI